MKQTNIFQDLVYNELKPAVMMILETAFSKEVRIAMKKGQLMKEHQTPYPIVIELVEGEIDFGVNATKQPIKKGDILTLDGDVPHDLLAIKDSIVRLTLSKYDKAERVEGVAKSS
jgi:quercetin dioxygenase-like cupin family protein